MELVVFDFDKTLTNYDTLTEFFYHYINRNLMYRLLYFFLKCLSKINVITVKKEKEILFNMIFNEINIENELLSFSETIKLNEIGKILKSEVSSGNRVIIISASPEQYLRKVFPSIEIYGTIINIKNERVLISQHPYGKDKLSILLNNNIKRIDRFYYDSKSDEVLLPICNEWFKIKNGKIIAEHRI